MYRRLIKELLEESPKLFIYIVFLMTLAGFLQAFSVIGIMPIVDLILNENTENASAPTLLITEILSNLSLPINVITLGSFYLLIVLIKSGILLYQQYVTSKFILYKMKTVIQGLYRSFIEASWKFFGTKQYGTLSNTVVGETLKATVAYESLAQIISTVLSLSFYIILAFLISWQLTFFTIGILILTFGPFWLIGRYVYKIRTMHTDAYNRFQGLVYDTLNGIKLIVGFSKRRTSLKNLDPITTTVADTGLRFVMVRTLINQLAEPITIIVVVIAVTLGQGYLDLTLGALFGFLYIINRSVFLVQNITGLRNELIASQPSLKQIFSLGNEAEISKENSGTLVITSVKKEIEIEDLDFSYNDIQTLSNVFLSIPQGEMIAIVGPSGSGKSTIIDLLMGFQVPDSGKIIIDGQNLKKLDLHSWRQLIGYIPQQPFLFNSSIADNLRWSKEDLSDIEIEQACEMAHASEFIQDLEQGYDTVIGERGVKLSGGQAQRLCLARALVKNPQILVLDEATSSLDSHSEKLIQKSIDDLQGQKTIISVAHRFSTIKQAHCIYYLDSGKILECGTYEELISKKESNFYRASKLQGT